MGLFILISVFNHLTTSLFPATTLAWLAAGNWKYVSVSPACLSLLGILTSPVNVGLSIGAKPEVSGIVGVPVKFPYAK